MPADASTNATPLSVIMPAYNEEDGIAAAVREVQAEVFSVVPNANLVVINDGSSDGTLSILRRLADQDERIAIIDKANSGHGPSIVQGLHEATGEFVFLIDSDRQIPLSYFADFWSQRKSYDAVFGVRQNRQDPLIRILLAASIVAFVQLIFRVQVVDTNVPCKLFRRQIWNDLFAKLRDNELMAPSIFIAIYAKKAGYKVLDLPVAHQARSSGTPSLNLSRLAVLCCRGLKQLLHYRSAIG